MKGLQMSWITVSDVNKAKTFFCDILGLKARTFDQTYGWMELVADEGSTLGVGMHHPQHSPIKPGQNAVVVLTVDDLLKTKADLEKKGVQFIGEVQEIPGHVKLALFKDPDGNLFQLAQKLGDD